MGAFLDLEEKPRCGALSAPITSNLPSLEEVGKISELFLS